MTRLAPHRSPAPLLDASRRPGYLHRRVELAAPERVRRLRRRRQIATCLACVTGAAAFFALYVLSWVLVLGV